MNELQEYSKTFFENYIIAQQSLLRSKANVNDTERRFQKALNDSKSASKLDDDMLDGFLEAKQNLENAQAELATRTSELQDREVKLKALLTDLVGKPVTFQNRNYSTTVTLKEDGTLEVK